MSSQTAADPREWLETVTRLLDDVEHWCRQAGWEVDRSVKRLHESKLGEYEAPVLKVRSPAGILYVEPVARHVVDADGLVDLYAWPSLRRLVLVRKGQRWTLRSESGVPWHQPWNAHSFADVARALTEPA